MFYGFKRELLQNVKAKNAAVSHLHQEGYSLEKP